MKRTATTLLIAGLLATPMLVLAPPAVAAISVGISVNIAPPPLPVYAQPGVPAPGYIWTPGYWAWDPGYGDYYWVPGTWVMPPEVGLLWTPGWWGWSDGYYRWNAGYWGPQVGFYGGIDYGHGYFGVGYVGGQWRGRQFYYNRAVNNVTNIRNVYVNRTVVNNVHVNRVSYNGGRGGITARPTAAQRSHANQRRVPATSMQTRQRDVAMKTPAQRFKSNQGRPAVFATQRAGNFSGPHAVRAPAAGHAAKKAAPERAHGMVTTPHKATAPEPTHGVVTAPHKTTAPERTRGLVTAPHNRPAAVPNREQGVVEAPRNRPQATRPTNQPPRAEHAAPVRAPERSVSRQPQSRPVNERAPHNEAPRNAASAHRQPAPAHTAQRGKAQPKKKPKQDNDGQHR